MTRNIVRILNVNVSIGKKTSIVNTLSDNVWRDIREKAPNPSEREGCEPDWWLGFVTESFILKNWKISFEHGYNSVMSYTKIETKT